MTIGLMNFYLMLRLPISIMGIALSCQKMNPVNICMFIYFTVALVQALVLINQKNAFYYMIVKYPRACYYYRNWQIINGIICMFVMSNYPITYNAKYLKFGIMMQYSLLGLSYYISQTSTTFQYYQILFGNHFYKRQTPYFHI